MENMLLAIPPRVRLNMHVFTYSKVKNCKITNAIQIIFFMIHEHHAHIHMKRFLNYIFSIIIIIIKFIFFIKKYI